MHNDAIISTRSHCLKITEQLKFLELMSDSLAISATNCAYIYQFYIKESLTNTCQCHEH